ATLITWIVIAMGMKKNKVLSFLFFFPLGIGLLISFVSPMMMYFRFLYLIPVMSLLLLEPKIMGKLSMRIGVLVLIVIFSMLYLIAPQFHREDWKKMVGNINPTKPVYMIIPSSDPVTYYNSTLTLFEIRNMQETALPEHIQVIPYVEELYGYNHTKILNEKGCIKEAQSVYRGPLILEDWKCPEVGLAVRP
ncbi:MAG: hypothetical protein NTZ55_05970, partial [Candidatus Roizmanbacteria bacterium]|nr:hypothetical protein [Candidatus Roizmanbacteria bacterium]